MDRCGLCLKRNRTFNFCIDFNAGIRVHTWLRWMFVSVNARFLFHYGCCAQAKKQKKKNETMTTEWNWQHICERGYIFAWSWNGRFMVFLYASTYVSVIIMPFWWHKPIYYITEMDALNGVALRALNTEHTHADWPFQWRFVHIYFILSSNNGFSF